MALTYLKSAKVLRRGFEDIYLAFFQSSAVIASKIILNEN